MIKIELYDNEHIHNIINSYMYLFSDFSGDYDDNIESKKRIEHAYILINTLKFKCTMSEILELCKNAALRSIDVFLPFN